jgi:hypothetical protein
MLPLAFMYTNQTADSNENRNSAIVVAIAPDERRAVQRSGGNAGKLAFQHVFLTYVEKEEEI